MKSVDKNQIEAVSEKYRVAEITAEKVIWLTRVLAEFSGSRIAEDFALMGGSAIVYLHADLYRFSTDLDLDFIANGDLGRENLSDLVARHEKDEKMLSKIADKLGLKCEKEEKKKDKKRFCQYHMFYDSVYSKGAKNAVDLDLSYRYCHSVLSTQHRKWPLCSEADVGSFEVQTFAEEELYAGKAVALIGGERYDFAGKMGLGFKNPMRHLYDIHFLASSFSKNRRPFDIKLFRRLLLLFGMTRIRNFDLQRGDVIAAFTQEDFDVQLTGVLRRHRLPPSLAEMQKRVRKFLDEILRWKGEEDRFIEDFKHKIFRPERILDRKAASHLKGLYYYDEIIERVQLPKE
jgi:predicted nucleotidyltransferase component of viral defense system